MPGYFFGEREQNLLDDEVKLMAKQPAFREPFKGTEPKTEMIGKEEGQLKPGKHYGKASGRKGSRRSSRK